MKQLVILDRQLNVKKLGLVKNAPTVFDTISPQKTTLELLKDESVNVGDIVSIKQYDTQEFLGIVQDVAVKNKTELYVYPFINAFNCECTMESINGYVYDWIVATMEANFVNIADNSLKLNLEFRNMMTLQPSLSYIFSDGNLFEALKKIFYITGVYLEFSLKFVNGIATAIYCDIYNTNDYGMITVRYDNPLLSGIPVIENSMNAGVNKIILKPEEIGTTYAFYLLDDNTVTTDQSASGRIKPVNQKIARYADETSTEELQLIAEKELLGEAYDHNIYFTIKKNDSYEFELYRKVKFINKDRTYVSYCSKIDKTQDNMLGITLGVIRNNLTDKIKDLEAQTSSLSSATSSGSGAIIPVLQWGNIGGSINNQADLKNALAGKIPTTEKGAVNGVATLGADGKLSSTQMPAIRVSDVYVVSSQAEMLALEADEGDVAKRTDLGKSYILNSGSPTLLSSWIPMVDDFEPLGAVASHNASETAHSTLFGGKVDKVAGKGLSTNDLTSELKTAYDGAVTDRHSHSNKTILDSTTASYTTEEETKLAGISGTNTGDETENTIKTKLGITTLSGSNTGDQTLPVNGDFTLSGLSEKNFSSLTNKPTSISGYGITDAYTETEINTLLTRKAVQPYIQRAYAGGNGARLIGTYNYSTSVGDTRPLFYLAGKQGHGNGTSYLWQGEFIFGVSTTGVVTAKAILTVSDGTYGKFYYRHDTVNKILYLYIFTGQYSSAYFSDLIQINAGNYSSYFTLASAGSVTTDTVTEGVNILYPASSGTLALTSDIPSTSDFLVASNIKAGTNITLSVSGKDVTINSTAGGGGTVTSVGITAGSGISVSGSPVTSSGNITVNNTGVLSIGGGTGNVLLGTGLILSTKYPSGVSTIELNTHSLQRTNLWSTSSVTTGSKALSQSIQNFDFIAITAERSASFSSTIILPVSVIDAYYKSTGIVIWADGSAVLTFTNNTTINITVNYYAWIKYIDGIKLTF